MYDDFTIRYYATLSTQTPPTYTDHSCTSPAWPLAYADKHLQ